MTLPPKAWLAKCTAVARDGSRLEDTVAAYISNLQVITKCNIDKANLLEWYEKEEAGLKNHERRK